MKTLFIAVTVLSLAGCAALTDSMANGAVNAAGGVADHTVSSAGDRAADGAINGAADSTKTKSSSSSSSAASKLEGDDVLVLDGTTYAVGKVLAGSATALLIADGRKIANPTVINVRAASKTELTVGADVFYCADTDVRRGRWAKGSVTDASKLSDNRIDVGAARGLDSGAQVAIGR